MTLPTKFSNVHYYRIAGKYTFAGDLFITRGALYFFPEVDLDDQRKAATEHVSHELVLIVVAVMYFVQSFRGAYSSRTDFWQEGISDEQFQEKARAHIDKLKAERASASFSKTLPLPTRVGSSEISSLELSAIGKLSFSAQLDTHDFKIGLFQKRRLRDALWESGLGRV